MKINTTNKINTANKIGKINTEPAAEKEYLITPLNLEQVFYIGTNEKGTDYYKNSQYFVFEAMDKEETPYTFKIDIKTMRIDTEHKVYYISKAADAEIMITVNKKNYKMLWEEFIQLYSNKKALGEVEVL